MRNFICSPEEAAKVIERGAVLMVAGSEEALAQLPKGSWIGGTSVYFMTDQGGMVDKNRVFCSEIDEASAARVVALSVDELPSLAQGRAQNGFTGLLIPAFSEAHTAFAMEASRYEGLFEQPVVGWIAGVHLDEIGKRAPKVYNGATGEAFDDRAVAIYVELPEELQPNVDIVSPFEQGDSDASSFVFDEDGFSATSVVVDGKRVNLAEHIASHQIDTRLPLVANYAGALVNVSISAVSDEKGEVSFYAPVTAGIEYRFAKPIDCYASSFADKIRGDGSKSFSCNCVLNYLYGDLEGRSTGAFTGPATFGEIAYILLNQTMVHLEFDKAA
ncbi:MAG: hypothetical protein MRY74_09155 [Neomegalonema sp.]|nr:hypothetical protein [Neomegalonema sp.]